MLALGSLCCGPLLFGGSRLGCGGGSRLVCGGGPRLVAGGGMLRLCAGIGGAAWLGLLFRVFISVHCCEIVVLRSLTSSVRCLMWVSSLVWSNTSCLRSLTVFTKYCIMSVLMWFWSELLLTLRSASPVSLP